MAAPGPDGPGFLSAVILAGGRARRLGGTDKPGITVGTQSLVARVAAAAAGAGARHLVIVGPDRPELPGLLASDPAVTARAGAGQPEPEIDIEFTREQPPGAGPVAALAAGLRLVREPWLLLLAADLPFLRSWHLRALAASAANAAAGALLLDDGGRPQWLTSCWPTAMLRAAFAGYHGYPLGGLLGPLSPVPVTFDQLALGSGKTGDAAGPPPWLDCDTPEDLAAARRLAEEEHDEHAGPVDRGGLRRA